MQDNGILGEEAVRARNFIELLLDATENPNTLAVPENVGVWSEIVFIIHQHAIIGYMQDGLKGAKRFAEKAIEGLSIANPELITLVGKIETEINPGWLAPKLKPITFTDNSGVEKTIDPVIPASLGKPVRKFIDSYMEYSARWAPRGHALFHEGAAIFILSAVAKGRIHIALQTGYDTHFYLVFAAETGKFTKSKTLKVAEEFLERAGMGWLLMSANQTTAYFYQMGSGYVPDNYDTMPESQQTQWYKQICFCGQRSIVSDEFGASLANMATGADLHKSGFNEVFLQWDNLLKSFSAPTVSGGARTIDNPYINLLAAMTPENYRSLANRKASDIWKTGLIPRFVMLTPPSDEFSMAPWPLGTFSVPEDLIEAITDFDTRLGKVEAEFEPIIDKKNKPTGSYRSYRTELPRNTAEIPEDVWGAFQNYSDALTVMCNQQDTYNIPKDLHGCYGRMAEKAMRIAHLLAWMESKGKLDIRHWAAAQDIVERWRNSMHEFYYQTVNVEITVEKKHEEQLTRILERKGGWANMAELRQSTGMSTEQLTRMLSALVEKDVIARYPLEQAKRGPRSKESAIYGLKTFKIPKKWIDRIIVEEESTEEKETHTDDTKSHTQ